MNNENQGLLSRQPGADGPAEPDRRPPARVYVSYAAADERHRERLEVYLAPLKRAGLIEPWHKRLALPGSPFVALGARKLSDADVVLLLVSADFLACDFLYEKEMQVALRRHARGEARIVPIIVGPVEFAECPVAGLEPLPRGARPVTAWPSPDEAWVEVAKGIRAVVDALPARPLTQPAVLCAPEPHRDPAALVTPELHGVRPDKPAAVHYAAGWGAAIRGGRPLTCAGAPSDARTVLDLALVSRGVGGVGDSRLLQDGDGVMPGEHLCCFFRAPEHELQLCAALSTVTEQPTASAVVDEVSDQPLDETILLRQVLYRLPEEGRQWWLVPSDCAQLRLTILVGVSLDADDDRQRFGRCSEGVVLSAGDPLSRVAAIACGLPAARCQMLRLAGPGTLGYSLRLPILPSRSLEQKR